MENVVFAISSNRASGVLQRRRAAVACLCCRARKVRCDYMLVGKPCTNCKLDSCDCEVQTSRRKRSPYFVIAAPRRRVQQQDAPPIIRPPLRGNMAPAFFSRSGEAYQPRIRAVAVEAMDRNVTRPTTLRANPKNKYGASKAVEGEFDESLPLNKSLEPMNKPCMAESCPAEVSTQHDEGFITDRSPSSTSSFDQSLLEEALSMEGPQVIDLVTYLDDGVTNASRKSNLLLWTNGALKARQASTQRSKTLGGRSWPHLLFSPALFHDRGSTAPSSQTSSREASSSTNTVASEKVMQPISGNFVLFSFYSFISLNSIWMINQDDASTLERSGCLHLPGKAALEEFVDNYFLYIHPALPILDEADFRTLYEERGAVSHRDECVPLCVVQAVIFAACSFVSLSTLRNLGFQSIQEARDHFYKICETLLRIDESDSPVSIAQCALLLTYHTQTFNDEVNTTWLKKAISAARDAQAHLYSSLKNWDNRKATLKRLWWCCLLRDRVMSLSLRCRLQISAQDFDLSVAGLGEEDFQEEIQHPLVYNSTTKRALAQLLSLVCELAVVLNDVLPLTYGTEPSEIERVCNIKEQIYSLEEWYDNAVAKVREITEWPELHQSAFMFINAMYIYYFTAKACIYDRLVLEVSSDEDTEAMSPYEVWHAMDEVDDAIVSITESFREIQEQAMTKYLPCTFIAFSAAPFLWQVEKSKQADRISHSGQEKVVKDLSVYLALFESFSGVHHSTESFLSRLKASALEATVADTDMLEHEILRHPLM